MDVCMLSTSFSLRRALKFLHERLNLTHTDLKAENVLFVERGPGERSSFPREDVGIHPRVFFSYLFFVAGQLESTVLEAEESVQKGS